MADGDGETLQGRYLFVVAMGWTQMLAQHRALALPLSTFGSDLPGFSVLSNLAPT